MKGLFPLFLVLNTASAGAENSKLIKVDLDVNATVLVKADLDQDELYYYIDRTACICWVAKDDKQKSYGTLVPCASLKAHPRLKEHVEKCEPEKITVVVKETAPAPQEAAPSVAPAAPVPPETPKN